jgi:hypothetical protein
VTNHNFGALLKIEIIKSIFASSIKNLFRSKINKKILKQKFNLLFKKNEY